MKKPLKVLSATALASVMAVSTLTPVAAAEQPSKEANYEIKEFIFVDGEKLAKLSIDEYGLAHMLSEVKDEIKYITYNDDKTYTLDDYALEYMLNGQDAEAAKAELDSSYEAVSQKIYEGYIDEDGKVRVKADEQPEDRLNETFFYNVA